MKKDINVEIKEMQKKLADLKKKQRQQERNEKRKAAQKAREDEIKLNDELIAIAKEHETFISGQHASTYEVLMSVWRFNKSSAGPDRLCQ